MIVIKVVDQDIADKIDTRYIASQFEDVQHVAITYICTREGGEEDEWINETGLRQIVIHLPYKVIQQMSDARPLMLQRAKERLGLVSAVSLKINLY